MNQVQEATETLIAAIKESKEYNRYQRAKQELRGNAFCRIVQQINWQLIENLDFEADFEGKQTEGFTDGGDYERQ